MHRRLLRRAAWLASPLGKLDGALTRRGILRCALSPSVWAALPATPGVRMPGQRGSSHAGLGGLVVAARGW
eukprot:3013339-Pyramimonas_sp.AAC.1